MEEWLNLLCQRCKEVYGYCHKNDPYIGLCAKNDREELIELREALIEFKKKRRK